MAAVLIFADSTADQLRRLTFGPGEIPGDVADHMHDLVSFLEGKNAGSFRNDVMGPLLNGETTGLFLARIERAHRGPVLFELDPAEIETVRLYRPVRRIQWGANWAVVAQFPPQQARVDTAGSWTFHARLDVPSYRMDVSLQQTFTADLDFAASATLSLRADEAVGPWLLFKLHPKLVVDSTRWADGTPATVFKAKESGDLWVRAPRRLAPRDSLTLTLAYHGNHPDLIDRFANWFFLDPGAAWYPINGQGRNLATFDLTFHSPSQYPLASVGDKVDSSVAGKVVTTHWVEQRPTPFATFNLGLFDNYHVQQPGAPPLDVLLSEEAHRELARQAALAGRLIIQQRHMRENVAADVSNSLKWYGYLFGEPPFKHFFVTEPHNVGRAPRAC